MKEDSTIKLSIIIPYYKTYKLTCVLLDNLCNQLTKETEIILIDDGCNETKLDKYDINIIHLPENKGLSYARNRGIEKAKGEYITFVDSDDNVSTEYIDKIIEKINSSEFDYCYFSWKFTGFKNEEVLIINDEAPEWNRCVWNCIYKRSIIGTFEEGIQINEDAIFNLKYRKGKRDNINDILYYYYFNRPESISNRFFAGKTKVQEEWMGQPLLSIIIPYYQTYELTRKLLDRLCPQINSKVEIILIQDGCNDNFDKYPVKVIKQENKGVSSARNKGLDTAIGKYITFIDSDDMVKENYIEKIISKIETSKFDYCLFSWEATGKLNKKFIIKEQPLIWNTCVWNCIYNKELIGNIRFNTKKQYEEDKEFNNIVRKGQKENIEDILYIYNSGREEGLTALAQKPKTIKSQIIIYRSYISLLGGCETAIYNACKILKDEYEIMVLYDTCDHQQLLRLKKLVRCVRFNNQQFECEKFIYYSFNPTTVENYVDAKEYIQQICCNIRELGQPFVSSPKITKFTADSQATANDYTNKYPNEKCGVLYNLFEEPEPKRVLSIMVASRLSFEKGYGRLKAMAKRMNEQGRLFTIECFTNDIPDENIEGFIFRTPRLNVPDYMWNKDYIWQFSDSESFGCTVKEALDRGIPVVCTDYASATEQVEHGKNGFILKRDMSNMDEIIEQMFAKDLKGFKHKSKDAIGQWRKLLGKGKKSDYVYTPNEIEEIYIPSNTYIANARIKGQDGNYVKAGQEVILQDSTRVKLLFERNLIKRMEE